MIRRAVALAAAMSVIMGMTAYAGEWQTNEFGWQYQQDDGTYADIGWNWINGKCYYFEPVYRYMDNPVCAQNTTINYCYTVDGTGALVFNGTVVEEGSELAKKLLDDSFSGKYELTSDISETDITGLRIERVTEKGELTMYNIIAESVYDDYAASIQINDYSGTALQTLDENGTPMLVMFGFDGKPYYYYTKDGNTLKFTSNVQQLLYQKN